MKRFIETHPGEILALAFIVMGLTFMLAVSGVEALAGLAGRGHDGLVNGAGWQAGVFPPPE